MDLLWSLLTSIWGLLSALSWLLEPLLKIVFVLVLLLTYAPILVWAERRQSAMMQDRVGPYKAGFPMPKAVLDGLPAAVAGAYGVAALSGLAALVFFVEVLLGDPDAVWFSPFGIDFTSGGLMLLAALSAGFHAGAGRILPSLFHDGRLTAFGLLHPLADAVKMIWKEDFTPPNADKLLFSIAPIVAVIPAFATYAVIPFGPTVYWGHLLEVLPSAGAPEGLATTLQVATINVGILYMFAIAGTGIVGAAIAGYSSDNKYALVGGLRAAGQMVSYEVTLGLSLIGCFMIYDTLLLQDMVQWQIDHVWGIFVQPLAFVVFFTASIAEYKRVPFDAPEGESEIVAGYFLEYSGMKWGMYMMGEFLEVVVSSSVITTVFLGGYDVPFLGASGWEFFGAHLDFGALDPESAFYFLSRFHVVTDVLNTHLVVVLTQIGAFLLKVALLCFLSLQVRWTLPRFRYDQIMQLCWKLLLPASLVNVLVTGVAILAIG